LNVVSKKDGDAASLLKMKAQSAKPIVKEISGMQSGEDDSLEHEVAMLSPMKGGEYWNSVQVRFALAPSIDTTWPLYTGEDEGSHLKAQACH